MSLRHFFLRVSLFSPVSIIPPVHHTHFIFDLRRYITLEFDTGVK